MIVAPSDTNRSVAFGLASTKSRCSRFLATFDSGNPQSSTPPTSRGVAAPDGGEYRIAAFIDWSSEDFGPKVLASPSASAQSKVMLASFADIGASVICRRSNDSVTRQLPRCRTESNEVQRAGRVYVAPRLNSK